MSLPRFSIGFLILLIALPMAAQTTGSVSGKVADSGGGAVPGVTVEAKSVSMQGVRTTVTDSSGMYRLPLLPPGEYALSYKLEGFAPESRSGITISLGKDTAVDISKFYTDQNLKDVMGPFLPAVTDGGKQFMMPTNFTTWGFFYNKEIFDRVGISPPKTWDEFMADAAKVQKAGFIGIATGGQPWQDATIFDGVALSTGGVDYYRKAFIELDQKTIKSPTTAHTLRMTPRITA